MQRILLSIYSKCLGDIRCQLQYILKYIKNILFMQKKITDALANLLRPRRDGDEEEHRALL